MAAIVPGPQRHGVLPSPATGGSPTAAGEHCAPPLLRAHDHDAEKHTHTRAWLKPTPTQTHARTHHGPRAASTRAPRAAAETAPRASPARRGLSWDRSGGCLMPAVSTDRAGRRAPFSLAARLRSSGAAAQRQRRASAAQRRRAAPRESFTNSFPLFFPVARVYGSLRPWTRLLTCCSTLNPQSSILSSGG